MNFFFAFTNNNNFTTGNISPSVRYTLKKLTKPEKWVKTHKMCSIRRIFLRNRRQGEKKKQKPRRQKIRLFWLNWKSFDILLRYQNEKQKYWDKSAPKSTFILETISRKTAVVVASWQVDLGQEVYLNRLSLLGGNHTWRGWKFEPPAGLKISFDKREFSTLKISFD